MRTARNLALAAILYAGCAAGSAQLTIETVTVGNPGNPGEMSGYAGGGYGEYRIMPTDGRAHSEDARFDLTYLGNTVGRWEGDTLVLDSIGFIDTTWLGRGGFFHSDQMRVVERFRRQGDALLYDVTVEDPEVLLEPYVLPTRTLRPNPSRDGGLIQERGNCDTAFETEAAATQIRH